MFKLFRDIHRKLVERHARPIVPTRVTTGVSEFFSGEKEEREDKPVPITPMRRGRASKVAKISLGFFVFVLFASTPAAELAYLAFLFGRYGKGKLIVGRIVVRMKHAVHLNR
jgi:hypothetical protein